MWHRLEDQSVMIDPQPSNCHSNDIQADDDNEADIEDMTFDPGDDLDKTEESCDMDSTEEEENDFQIVQECTVRTCWHYKYCYVCVYIILVIILLATLIAFIVVILLVVMPFTRASSFQTALCKVTGATTHMAESTCSCGKGCDSRYPCMLIEVEYSVTPTENFAHNASIHENEVLLDKQVIQSSIFL